MKYKVGEKVKISKNNSLLFNAAGLTAKIENIISAPYALGKKKYVIYEVIVKVDGTEKLLCVEEQELTRG